jgi:hypothetical protein
MQRCIRFTGQNLAYKSYEAFQAIKKWPHLERFSRVMSKVLDIAKKTKTKTKTKTRGSFKQSFFIQICGAHWFH